MGIISTRVKSEQSNINKLLLLAPMQVSVSLLIVWIGYKPSNLQGHDQSRLSSPQLPIPALKEPLYFSFCSGASHSRAQEKKQRVGIWRQ